MRVLLLAMPDTAYWMDHVMRMPNLALGSLAAAIPDHDVRVLDLVLVKDRLKRALDQQLETFRPELVGLSAMTFQYSTLVKLAAYLRRQLPAARLVAGGYHVTLLHREIADATPDLPLDFMVRGEGEATLAQLVDALAHHRTDFSGIAGLSWRRGDATWQHNADRALLDLSQLALPDRDARQEHRFYLYGDPIDVVETSRGCPLGCTFCSIRRMYGATFRRFPVERIVRDIERVKARGARAVFFVDDNITHDADHFASVCQAIIERGLNSMEYSIQASAHGIARHPALVELMDRANFRMVSLGLESMDPAAIKFMKKGTSVELNSAAVQLLRRHRIGVNALFIVGFPDDTEQSIRANFRQLVALRPDTIYGQILTPYPKTEVREQLLAAGLVENADDYSRYDGFHCNVRTKHLSCQALDRLNTREQSKTMWPLTTTDNYFLRRYFWQFFKAETKVLWTVLGRRLAGKSRQWSLEL